MDFRGKTQIFLAAMTCPESFSSRTPSVLAGRHKSWRSQGGEEILEVVNAEYQKTKAKQ